ncbi:MAG: inositol monophosphatase [Candidatus Omnitrophica bacterium]|nr:inositol monophosphatase [Candidatus Omnitrophota bacterium]
MKLLKKYQAIAERTAIEAGSFLMKNLGKIKSIHYKGRMNLTTNVDKKCEALIVERVRSAFPEHSLLCEETGKGGAKETTFRWLIDPLDGTTNYTHGFPFFSVSIGLLEGNKLLVGVVYDPTRDELFSAARGCGAYLNKKRIRVSRVRKLNHALLVTGFPYRFGKDMNRSIENFRRFMLKAQAVRRAGSAALDLCYVAMGRFDGFWEAGLHPWDTAAGAIIVEEAGGRMTTFDGESFSPFRKEMIGTNSHIHNQMIKVLK